MYQFTNEKRKEKIYKLYLILFIVSALINEILIFADGNMIRGIASLLFYFIVMFFGLQRKAWSVIIIKFMVWIHIIILLLMILSITIK
ncbi:hypothetical protein [Bacillus sp. AFS029533]|uniref:hypothetical protein n=1 Tax=Bacillus sp. AFS029533 TaxID=2033494 RepID=UPI000BFC2F54|nr:hypothetical protein [Bacillus sp. AFS029533]PGZ93958.1 hypothetical protein COE53_04350 [Bacillus sp. AFS029533]